MPTWQGRDLASHGQDVGPFEAGQLEGRAAGDRALEGRVAPASTTKAERSGRVVEGQVEAIGLRVQACYETSHQPGARRNEYRKSTYTPNMPRAVIYARISMDREGTKVSPEIQEAECRGLCERRGWEVVAVYCDRDRSAFKLRVKRPQFDRARRSFDKCSEDGVEPVRDNNPIRSSCPNKASLPRGDT